MLQAALDLLRLGTHLASAHWQMEPPKSSWGDWDLACLYLPTQATLTFSRPLSLYPDDQRVRSVVHLLRFWFSHPFCRPDDVPA